jgi:GT2 family glycosyltransferase
MLLNPDAAIVEGTANDLLQVLSRPDRPAIVGPRTVGPDGVTTRTVRRFPTPAALFFCQLKLHPLARWIAPLHSYFMLDFKGNEAARVDQVIGAAFAMRRDDWEHYRGLDEGYFLLFEEVDLCRRVARDGRFALFWPEITVRHIGATSFRRLSHVQLQRIWNKSLLRYARLNFGPAALLALRLTVPVGLAAGAARDCLDRSRRAVRKLQSGAVR